MPNWLQRTGSQRPQYQHQHQGYQENYQQAPHQPQGDPRLWQLFSMVDADRSGSIDVHELQNVLVNGNYTKFDLDTVKMLMNMFDVDRNGLINFQEFCALWDYLAQWQEAFRRFDTDHSGTIEGHEMYGALQNFGYPLSRNLMMMLERKYSSGPVTSYGPPPGITFDHFVRACVTVRTLSDAFRQLDTNRDGWIELNHEQFMRIFLSMP